MAESTSFEELIRPRRRPTPPAAEAYAEQSADTVDAFATNDLARKHQPAGPRRQRVTRADSKATGKTRSQGSLREIGVGERKKTQEEEQAPRLEGRTPVVVVKDLHVRYKVYSSGKTAGAAGGRRLMTTTRGLREVHAVKGISFTAYENESIGIIGSNGSGKSTLMRSIVGLTPPASGAVYASSRPNMLGVGAALIPDLSGDKNITLGGLALGYSRKEIEEMRRDIIEFAELEDFIDLPMRTYSSGMSARLKFAIAASKQHEILIVDEALAVGDARFRKRSEARIREIREQAGTVFLVSHSMKSILDTCNRVLWINKGVLEMDGDAKDVVKAYQESKK